MGRACTACDRRGGIASWVGWVLVSEHSPTSGMWGWQEMLLPLTPAQLMRPSKATIRALRFDLLLPTDEFLALVSQWGQSHRGLRAWQLRKHPRADVRLDDERPGPRAAKYNAHGLVLGIDLPSAHDRCLLVTLDEPAMDATLARIDNTRWPPLADARETTVIRRKHKNDQPLTVTG